MAVLFEMFRIPCPLCGEKTARVGRERDGAGRTLRVLCGCGTNLQVGITTNAGKNIARDIALARPKHASSQSSSLSHETTIQVSSLRHG